MATRPLVLEAEASRLEPPYPPGWLDRLSDAIKRLPGPEWPYYIGLLLVQAVWVSIVLWLNRKAPFGSLAWARIVFVFVVPYFLWSRSILDAIACRALDAYRPALRVSDAELAVLRYELTTLPARNTNVVTAVAALAMLVNIGALAPRIVEEYGASPVVVLLELGPLVLFALSVTFVTSYQAIYQLQKVAHLHSLATEIRIFQARPLYAFSKLTASTGVSFLLVAYGLVGARPDIALGTPMGRMLLLALVPTAVLCFIVPLYGMHQRIAAEKDRLLAEANDRFARLIARLHQRVDEELLAEADKLNAQISSVAAEREALARLPTWPWDPTTLTAFITTLVAPAVLWLLTRLAQRLGL